MIDFAKGDGLVPVIIQDVNTLQVLMLGYMNLEAYNKTLTEKRVTFFSRSKQRLWTKGEVSGNFLQVADIREDCDSDTLLIKVFPAGPVCHTGSTSCFGEETAKGFVYSLQSVIEQRIKDDASGSYTNALFKKGVNKVAQKVGEEAVELVVLGVAFAHQLHRRQALAVYPLDLSHLTFLQIAIQISSVNLRIRAFRPGF